MNENKKIVEIRIFRVILIFFLFLSSEQLFATNIISNAIEPKQYFVGRNKELSKIQSYFDKNNGNVSVVGISGIGKTELVRKYVELSKNNYEIIWFFDVNTDLRYQFQDLANQLSKNINKTLPINKDLPFVVDSVMHYLVPKQSWLLIFDNIKIGENQKVLEILSNGHNGNVIIASQDKEDLPNIININALSEKDSAKVVKSIIGNTNHNKIKQISTRFDGYPVVIVTAATFLKQNKYIELNEYESMHSSERNYRSIKKMLDLMINELSFSAQELLIECALLNNHYLSKDILYATASDKDNFNDNIYQLSRFSMISDTPNSDKSNITEFEMHDLVKKNIIETIDKDRLNRTLDNLIIKINYILSEDVIGIPGLIEKHPHIKEHLEEVLKIGKEADISLEKELLLRKNLLSLYLYSLDYQNAYEIVKWLENKNLNKDISTKLERDALNALGWCYLHSGVYYDFSEGNAIKAKELYSKALELMDLEKDEHAVLKYNIFAEIAQTQLYEGDVDSAKQNMENASVWLKKVNNTKDVDAGLFHFINARLHSEMGGYEKANNEIDKCLEFDFNLPIDQFTAPTHLLKAEILSNIGNHQESYQIIKNIFDKVFSNFEQEHEFKARALIVLARAELNLEDKVNATKHIKEALNILSKLPRNMVELEQSDDADLADALVIKADLELLAGENVKALDNYKKAYMIFKNRYKGNLKNDRISQLLLKLSMVNIRNKDIPLAQFYASIHENIFGLEHYRANEIYKAILN